MQPSVTSAISTGHFSAEIDVGPTEQGGCWTIGDGHLCDSGHPGHPGITEDEADIYLARPSK
ncbi:MAG: hypothetical protein Q8O31_02520 [Rhodocyclaceae bacterium]|nr:hypothetical protein [Rhodocyclaceae bacterium]